MRNSSASLFLITLALASLGCSADRGRGGAVNGEGPKREDGGPASGAAASVDAALDPDAVRPPGGAVATLTVLDAAYLALVSRPESEPIWPDDGRVFVSVHLRVDNGDVPAVLEEPVFSIEAADGLLYTASYASSALASATPDAMPAPGRSIDCAFLFEVPVDEVVVRLHYRTAYGCSVSPALPEPRP